MEDGFEETRGLKHRPVVLLPYAAHDGFYHAQTDCRYISIGWAQYDPRKLSVKTLRRPASEKRNWSRQSEELPLHRCVDGTLLIAETVAQVGRKEREERKDCIEIREGTFERQDEPMQLRIRPSDESAREGDETAREEFEKLLEDPVLRRRLKKLADTLFALNSAGAFETADDVGHR